MSERLVVVDHSVLAAAVDRELDQNAYIRPGLGTPATACSEPKRQFRFSRKTQ